MDDLTDRVRRVYADRPAPDSVDTDALLERVHAGAARRSQRRKGVLAGAAGVAALVVVGTVGSGILAGGGMTTSPQAGAGSAAQEDDQLSGMDKSDADAEADGQRGQAETMMDAPVPSNLSATSLTAVSPDTFWVLGATGGEPALVRTDDGGKSFTSLRLPDETASLRSSSGVEPAVRFADENNGWYFGRGGLWATHDGADTWSPIDAPASVDQLEAAGGYVYVLADGQLRRSSTDEDSWQELDADLTDPADLAVSNDLLVITDRNETGTRVLVSGNAGEDFDEYATPCAPELSAGLVSAASDDGLWLSCPTGMAASVVHSTDGGRSWEPVSTGGPAVPNSAIVAARDAHSAVVMFVGRAIPAEASTELSQPAGDEGNLPQLGDPVFAGFTTPEVGYVIDTEGALFRTTDGGASWDSVEFQ